MRIERNFQADAPEWRLSTSRRDQPLATVREFNGCFFVLRAGADPSEPPLVFRRFIDALNAVTPKTLTRRAERAVYVRGALTRRRVWED